MGHDPIKKCMTGAAFSAVRTETPMVLKSECIEKPDTAVDLFNYVAPIARHESPGGWELFVPQASCGHKNLQFQDLLASVLPQYTPRFHINDHGCCFQKQAISAR